MQSNVLKCLSEWPCVQGCLFSVLYSSLLASSVSAFTFTEVTVSAGVDYLQHSYDTSPAQDSFRQIWMTGGAAAGDYDGDGWVDLYVTRLDETDILFRNNQDGTFSDATTSAFGPNPLAIRSNGAQWGDIDNDGDQDLYVTSINSNGYHLYVNDGAGHFTEEATVRGADIAGIDPHFGQSAAFGDYDLDGYLDLHTTEWRVDADIQWQDFPFNARLLRNAGAAAPGTFTDTTVAAGVDMHDVPTTNPNIFEAQSFASRFTDLDRDGHPDLIVSSDHRSSRLYWNNGDGTFTDGTVNSNVGTDEYGMGSTVGDYDGDGDLDWLVTSINDDLASVPARDGNRLYRNDGNRVFTDATDAANVRSGDWGWGATFVDFDNDGDLDIAQTNGIDWPDPYYFETYHGDFVHDPMRVWINDGNGQYTEASFALGATDVGSGKGLLVLDYDNDGDQDLFIVNNGEHPVLYRNDGGNDNNWLKVDTNGTVSNRDGINAFITVTPDLNNPSESIVSEIDGGSNFLGQNERLAHFGLGQASNVDLVTIEWPSGIIQRFTNVDANSILIATESVSGDFDADGQFDCADIDALMAGIASSEFSAKFDVDADGNLDGDDLAAWLAAAGEINLGAGQVYLVADANLDGTVDGADFLAWSQHKFTSGGGWCGGDFNADGSTDGRDFLLWNANKFNSSSALAVPEPTVASFLLLLSVAALRRFVG